MKEFSFNGTGLEYFKIWIVNVILIILTLGLYYPWARVRSKRYLYANSSVEGRTFEYHATGKQLFFAYLIAMFLLITYIVLEKAVPAGSFIVLLGFFLILPWVIVKSMTFGLKMTTFSNVRFDFFGTLKDSYINFLALPLLMYVGLFVMGTFMIYFSNALISLIFSLGIIAYGVYALSFLKKRNTEFFINNTLYGNAKFSTELDLRELVNIRLRVFGVAILIFIVSIIMYATAVYGILGDSLVSSLQVINQDPEHINENIKSILPLIAGIYLLILFDSIFINAYSFVKHREYIFANSQLDSDVKFLSRLSVGTYAWVVLSNFILVIITLGFAFPWAKVRVARVVLENTYIETPQGFDNYITQKQEESSSLGDQIGEVFDMDVGIGI